jgi:TPR repeat protein
MLAILLTGARTVKRDPVAARYWAERAVANPAKDASKADLQVLLGRLLAESDSADERARGLDILERMARRRVRRQAGVGDRHPQGRSGSRAHAAGRSRCGPIPAARRRRSPKC